VIRSVGWMLAAMAILGLVAGCGSSAATPLPKPTPSPTPIREPDELIARSLSEVLRVEAFHVRADVSGKASLSLIGGGGSILGALGAAIDLGGSYLEGDVGVRQRTADLRFEVPGFPMGLTGEVIVADGFAYTRISIQGDKFSRSALGDALLNLETPAPSGSGSAGRIEAIRGSLRDAGVSATMKPMELVEGRSCYHVSISVPLDRLNATLSQAGGYAARISVESTAIDYWAFEDTLLPARLELTADAGGMGNFRAEVVFSRYGETVTIEAPDPGSVN